MDTCVEIIQLFCMNPRIYTRYDTASAIFNRPKGGPLTNGKTV